MMQKSHTPFTQGLHIAIVAAGSGQRFGSEIPKQYQMINGKSVLRHTLEKFLALVPTTAIRVIINPKHIEWYHEAVMGLDLPDPVNGNSSRKLSINNYINQISYVKDEDIILVHDAVRPIISHNDIKSLIHAAAQYKAATLATSVSDTLRRMTDQNEVSDIIDRSGLWALQTPQGFHFKILKQAHIQADAGQDYTDDTSLVSALGVPVKIVPATAPNIKITTQADLELVSKIMNAETETRTGMGFDVHAFDADPKRKLMLCGIEITGHRGLKGHSDADVALHTLTDALLGAMAEGDIGHHFPPSDNAYKNMDSRVFLEKAASILKNKGGSIQNVDLTIICETPKIGPYREGMQAKISEILSISPHRVSVKATTTEKLGFTGRGEGIAAQAVITIKIPAGS